LDGIPVPFAITNTFENQAEQLSNLKMWRCRICQTFFWARCVCGNKGKKKKTEETTGTDLVGYEMIDKVYGVIGTVLSRRISQQLIATCIVNSKEV